MAKAAPKAPPAKISALESALNAAAARLDQTDAKRMFGCHALFAKGQVFCMVWKEGRIGVRLPDSAAFGELMAKKGAAPWRAGPKVMSHWVLVPEKMADDKRALGAWVKRAHALALAAPNAKAKK